MSQKTFKELFSEAKLDDEYWVHQVIFEFTENVSRIMKREGVSRSDLAKLLGTTPAYVTKMLRGNANFTISSMVKIARKLHGNLHIHVASDCSDVRWFEVHKRPTPRTLDLSQFESAGGEEIRIEANTRAVAA